MVLFAVINTIAAQSEIKNFKPKVIFYESKLTAENFPAYSKKENAILVFHETNYCSNCSGFILKIDISTMAVMEKFMLFPHEDSIDLIDLNENKIILDVEKKVKNGMYQSMVEINKESFELSRQLNSETYTILFELEGAGLKQTTVKIPGITLPAHCCNEGSPGTASCTLYPNEYRMWIDAAHRLIMLEYGIFRDMKGCVSGPAYQVKRI